MAESQPFSGEYWLQMKAQPWVLHREHMVLVTISTFCLIMQAHSSWRKTAWYCLLLLAKLPVIFIAESENHCHSTAEGAGDMKALFFFYSLLELYCTFGRVRVAANWLEEQHSLIVISGLSCSISCLFH